MAASSDKGLEDSLMDVGARLTALPSTAEELLDLLDLTESFLSRVEQSPSPSMSAAIRPAREALVTKNLLDHTDMDVKVAVASCVSEITRITAPEAPYDDDLMKVIFQLIVEAFKKFDDLSSRSFLKRISILETVAKVRSCVVMLDLECDALILEMFHYFLKNIRSNHPENVFSSMETIMTLVLEESEDISSELLSCLIDSVKKDNKEVQPIAHKLGEKVISNCAAKLKPYLMQVQSLSALCAHSKIVASICQENSNALEQNERNNSGEILVDESKLSERTVSDELPQGSVMAEQEAGSPEKNATAEKSPRSVTSNGTIQRRDGETVVEPSSPDQKPEHSPCSSQSKNNVAAGTADSDNLEPMKLESISMDLKTKKRKGRKPNSSNQGTDTSEYSRNDSDKEVPSAPSKTANRDKEAVSSQVDGPSAKLAETAVSLELDDKKDNLEPINLKPSSVDLKTKKRKGRKPRSSIQVMDTSEFSRNDSDKEVPSVPSKITGRNKDVSSSQVVDRSAKQAETAVSPEPEDKNDSLEPMNLKSDNIDHKTKKRKGRKPKSSVMVTDTSEFSRNDSDIEVPSVPSKITGRNKEADSSQVDVRSAKRTETAVSPELDDKNDSLEQMNLKSDSIDQKTKKRKGRKPKTSIQVTDTSEFSQNESNKEVPSVHIKISGRKREAVSSPVDFPSGKRAETAVSHEPEDKNNLQPSRRSDNGSASHSSRTPSEDVLGTNRPKRGRPSKKKVVSEAGEQPASTSGGKGAVRNGQSRDEISRSEDRDSKKEVEAVTNSEGKPQRRLGKKVHLEIADDADKLASLTGSSEAKPAGKTGIRGLKKKVREEDSSGKKQKSYVKQPKGKISVEKDAAGELSLKDMPSPKSEANTRSKDENQLVGSAKTSSRRKRSKAIDTEELSEAPDHKLKLNESLVGARIKVWWPDDSRFYDGTVHSFDPVNEKHKVLYDDGEDEILLLEEERFEFIGDDNQIDVDQAKDVPSHFLSPEVPPNKKAKANSASVAKQGKSAEPKAGSSKKSKEKPTIKSNDETPNTTSGKPKGRPRKKPKEDDTPKLGSVRDDTTSITTPKLLDVPRKPGRKPKDGTPKTSNKLKDVTTTTPKLMDDESMEDTPKTSSAKSSQATLKVGRRTKQKGYGTPKTTPIDGGGSSKKAKEPAKAQEIPGSTGKKRKRKGSLK